MCSTISIHQFDKYIETLYLGDIVTAIHILYDIYDNGYSVIDILDFFFTFIKNTYNLDEDFKYKIIPYLCKYITIFNKIHEDQIELAFFTNNLYNNIFKK